MKATGFLFFLFFYSFLLQADPPKTENCLEKTKEVFIYDGIEYKTQNQACAAFMKTLNDPECKMKSCTINSDGNLACVYKCGDYEPNTQISLFSRKLYCPENTHQKQDEAGFSTCCECPAPNYKITGKQCTLVECLPWINADSAGIRDLITEKLQAITDSVNLAFAENPEMADTTKLSNKAAAKMPFVAAYGHALERLVAEVVKDYPCIKDYIKYVPNTEQTVPGGKPDFEGVKTAAGLQFDITTEKQAEVKSKTEAKKDYIFITYTRLLEVDYNTGTAVKAE